MLLIIGPQLFFHVLARLPKTAQKQKSRTTKSLLMQDWVFRLGYRLCLCIVYEYKLLAYMINGWIM